MWGLYLYTSNRSQILQYVECIKWINITKGIAKFHVNNVFGQISNNNKTKKQT